MITDWNLTDTLSIFFLFHWIIYWQTDHACLFNVKKGVILQSKVIDYRRGERTYLSQGFRGFCHLRPISDQFLAFRYCRCPRRCVCVRISVCVNHELVPAMSPHPLKIGSPFRTSVHHTLVIGTDIEIEVRVESRMTRQSHRWTGPSI